MGRCICVDIDGTLTDPYFFIPILNKITGKNLTPKEYISNNWIITYGPEFADEYKSFDYNYSDRYIEAEIVDLAKETIDELVLLSDEVYFVTARSKNLESITKQWLSLKGLDEDKVVVLGTNREKVPIAKKLNCDVFIEDDPRNIKNLLLEGFNVIVINTNYNRCIEKEIIEEAGKEKAEEVIKNMKRVDNWKEIKELLISTYN